MCTAYQYQVQDIKPVEQQTLEASDVSPVDAQGRPLDFTFSRSRLNTTNYQIRREMTQLWGTQDLPTGYTAGQVAARRAFVEQRQQPVNPAMVRQRPTPEQREEGPRPVTPRSASGSLPEPGETRYDDSQVPQAGEVTRPPEAPGFAFSGQSRPRFGIMRAEYRRVFDDARRRRLALLQGENNRGKQLLGQ